MTAFAADFYLDPEAARLAVQTLRLFNLLHLASGIKVDFVVRKSSEYRRLEFERRAQVQLAGVRTWIVSREDLILSKLVWARNAASELQLRDVRALLQGAVDADYLNRWAAELGRRRRSKRSESHGRHGTESRPRGPCWAESLDNSQQVIERVERVLAA